MKLSLNWLCDYVDVKNLSTKDLASGLTMGGCKVEKIEEEFKNLEKIVIGKVISIENHENANRLVVCSVLVDESTVLKIVTGATNVKEGALVPVCLDGGKIYNGTKIKAGKLRKVLSQGMMCSLSELGLNKSHFPYAIEDGIFLIEEDCKIGQDVKEALGLNDSIAELEITLNRPDCLSIVGLAREVSAIFNLPLKINPPQVKKAKETLEDLKIEIKTPSCTNYIAKIIKNVKVGPSQRKIRERLRASGITPINNIVDITNYVMLEYGLPMHAFDLKKIKNRKIVVRDAKNGEVLKTLNDSDRKLTEDMVVVCSDCEPISIAGIIGGKQSGITEDTTDVVFEAACFKEEAIRKASKKLLIRTESSIRFEKGLNPSCCENSMNRACELVELLNVGQVSKETFKGLDYCEKEEKIDLNLELINKLIGIEFKREDVVKILESLEFRINGNEVIVPNFRIDIKNNADLAEEVARIYGYNKIDSKLDIIKSKVIRNREEILKRRLQNILVSCGCSEIYCYSFLNPKEYLKLGLNEEEELKNSVKILNPIGDETSVMRKSLIPSMVSVLEKNYKNRNESAWLFEIGKIYYLDENSKPKESQKIAIGLYGNGADFYIAKGIVENVLEGLNISGYKFKEIKIAPFHPFRSCNIFKDDVLIGTLGEIHKKVLKNYKINSRIFMAILDFNILLDLETDEKKYIKISKFPSITRDLSLVCEKNITSYEIEEIIKEKGGKLVESVDVFDVFEGGKLEKTKKSISYKIVMRSKTETLTANNVDGTIEKILKKLNSKGITLRDF